MSKIEAGKLALETIDFDVVEVVGGTTELLKESARKKGLTLECKFEATTPAVLRGDPFRLRQILTNLIANATKFTSEGGIVVTVTDVAHLPPTSLRFAVRDTGPGIAPDVAERIFDSFQQADDSTTRKFGGTGLGLTIAKQLAEMMEGEIGVESEAGTGSTFWFTARFDEAKLDRTPERAATPQERPPEPAVEHSLGLQILLVEDNGVNRLVGTEILRSLGCTVESAENGALAVDVSAHQSFDLILMDCQMPEMDGFEATAAIRRRERDQSATSPGTSHCAHRKCHGWQQRTLPGGWNG